MAAAAAFHRLTDGRNDDVDRALRPVPQHLGKVTGAAAQRGRYKHLMVTRLAGTRSAAPRAASTRP